MKMHPVKPRSWKEEMGSPSEKHRPSFQVNLDNLPEAEDWKNGEFYEVKMIVKQTSSSEKNASFEIHEIGGEEAEDYEADDEDPNDTPRGKGKTSQQRYSRSAPSSDEE